MAIVYPQMLTTEQAAAVLNIHSSTLEKGRQSHRKGLFPPYVKIGKAVRYRLSDLENWLQANTIQVGEV